MSGDLDARNAEFWDELCGTTMAKAVGVTGRSADDLRKFDDAYLSFYPYLTGYLPDDLHGKRVLEIGLGYGTLGSVLVDRGARYTGVDISPGPVDMMRHRIALAGREAECDARQASALALPFTDGEFDVVVSIGCLHHTGDLAAALTEVRRVLRPGGVAVIMVYNRYSARRIVSAPRRALAARRDRNRAGAAARAQYDADQAGNAAPHTDFASRGELRRMLHGFSTVDIEKRNIDVAHLPPARSLLLQAHVDRLVGLDLYARAVA